MKLSGNQDQFFQMLQDHSRLVQQASRLLADGAGKGGESLKVAAIRIGLLEQEADEVIHRLFVRLNRSFLTPIDPEDLHRLGAGLDDVLDGVEDAAYRLAAYQLDRIPDEMLRVCGMVQRSADSLAAAVVALSRNEDLTPHCVEINRLENEADQLTREAVDGLLTSEPDAILVLKLKEIYEFLEETMDRSEDVADVLRNVVVKNH
jgi:predicted phosphate transport protein (TIGR00153 family)